MTLMPVMMSWETTGNTNNKGPKNQLAAKKFCNIHFKELLGKWMEKNQNNSTDPKRLQ